MATAGNSDRAIIDDVLGGDVNAFESLVERYHAHVCSIVYNHIPSDEAEEIVHEVFIRAFHKLGTFRENKPFEHWLAKLAVRICYDFWRRRKRMKEVPLSDLTDDHAHWFEKASQATSEQAYQHLLETREARDVLDWALAKLTPPCRTVLTLLHRDGYSVAEAARLMNWSQSKVKVQAFRSRKQLRTILDQHPALKGVLS